MKLRAPTFAAFSSALLATAVSLTIALADGGAAQAKPRSLAPNMPTRANFGVVFNKGPLANFSFKHGVLSCVGIGLTDCTVTNMALIAQGGTGDTTLRDALAAYVQKYVVASGPNKGMVVWSEPEFNLGPTPLLPADFAQRVLDNGCYIASLTTLENAVLANLAGAKPKFRAATFNAIDTNKLYTASKPYNQLLWQYERWADILQPNKADPTKPTPGDFLEFPEFGGDFTPPGQVAFPPLDGLSDAKVIEAMKQDKLTLFEYQRYTPTVVFSPVKGTYAVTLTNVGQHKVAVSGFQPGSYPLTINDVGDGQARRVHITESLSDLKWSLKVPGKRWLKSIPASAINLDPTFAGQPILVYEGADNITLNDPTAQIIIIDATQELGQPPSSHVLSRPPNAPYAPVRQMEPEAPPPVPLRPMQPLRPATVPPIQRTPAPSASVVPETPAVETSTLCRFTEGPRRGQTQDYAPMAPIAVGSSCQDARGSTGVVVAR